MVSNKNTLNKTLFVKDLRLREYGKVQKLYTIDIFYCIIPKKRCDVGKKTGFLMAAVHQGSGSAMWNAISAEAAKRPDDALFVFPGGRLMAADSSDYLRNDIFRLANSNNLDGEIIWASSLTGKVGYEEVISFLKKKNEDLPVVSLGLILDGVSSVDFDAYSGAFKVITHLIKHHGMKKIAFLRGPEAHFSAQARYRAYQDALKENGIAFNPDLVASSISWTEGYSQAKELVEGRGLVPGRDFDAVLAASDLILFWATKYFEKAGVRIPSQLKTVGFNDSEESCMTSVPSTTVRMPIKGLAATSMSLMHNMIDVPGGPSQGILLPTDLIIRRSCGCSDSFGGREKARAVISDWQSLKKWIYSSTESTKCAEALYAVLRELYVVGWSIKGESADSMNIALEKYYENGGSAGLLFESMKWAEEILGCKRLGVEERELIHGFSIHHASRVSIGAAFEERSKNQILDHFSMDLLAASTMPQMLQKMKEYLPKLSVNKAFIVLFKNDDTSVFSGGFDGDSIYRDIVEFPAHLMIDKSLSDNISKGIFLVEPLIFDNSCVGYAILGVKEPVKGTMIEDIRSTLSAALKSIELFRIASEKSASAEAAEKKSAEFYANLSEGLREPLTSIRNLADSDGPIDKDELRNHVTKAAHLLELSLSERGEVQIKASFVPSSILFEDIRKKLSVDVSCDKPCPALCCDRKYIMEVLRILNGIISAVGDRMAIHAEPKKDAMCLTVKGRESLWFPRGNENDSSMLLIEKIIMLHSGSYKFSNDSFSINIPYPSLSGVSGPSDPEGCLIYVSKEDEIPAHLEAMNAVLVKDDSLLQTFALPENASAIAWDASQDRKSSTIILNLLKNHISTKNLPFLCYGIEKECITLTTALEGTLPQADKATIYSFGKFPQTLRKLSEFGSLIEASSLDDAESMDGEGALIILYSIDIATINSIRKSRKFGRTPILIVKDYFDVKEAELLSETPSVLMVNTSITESEDFISRIVGIFGGGELLPPLTSALVKRSIAFINKNAASQISRWQLAAAVNISEDYLTRVFRREIGLSPWDYLNRYRIQIACRMLTETGASVNEIASDTGFQDQAYFCRVFKKVKGFPPGHLRQRS